MKTRIKPAGKVVILLLFCTACYFGIRWWQKAPKKVEQSAIVGKVVIPDAPQASLQGNAAMKLELPGDKPALNGGLKIVHNEMAWQGQTSFNYANGGDRTTKGSLFDKAGLDIQIVRQDNCTQSCTDMIKWINDYKNGATKDGFIITFMGSGVPAYLRGINEAVAPLGPEYAPVAFMSWGKSYGEDQIIGNMKYKRNPQTLKGAVLRGVRMDGDIDLALKFCGDNNIPINANEKLYDRNALNLSYSNDFLSAVVDYNTGVKETRTIMENGKTTTKDTTVGYDLVATWTPGDVNVANGRGGVTIISTAVYASIMPAIAISCKKWLNDNRTKIEDMIAAVAMAGDQIRSFEDIKKKACIINAKVWNEKDGEYWYKYYNGAQSTSDLHLGGSMVFNLADISKTFGLSGSSDIYREVYNTFGKLQSGLYKKDLPNFVDYQKAIDKSFMNSVVSNHPELLEGKPLEVQYADNITEKVASKDVHINFETGSAAISPSSLTTLNEIYSAAQTADGLKIGIYGHTDNTGLPATNLALSKQRAESVMQFLMKKGIKMDRIESKGFGATQPIEDNSTLQGKAANRRVQIVLGN